MCSWWSPPFGPAPLNALHAHLVHAAPFDWTAVALWVVASAPMLLQAYLLLAPGTRVARAAIGALGVGLLVHAWTGYRVYGKQKG
jgi:hypothetical protein